MLRLLVPSKFDACVEFAYQLALDPARSGYPTYCDGMKTREDFITRAKNAYERPTEDILLFEEAGQVEGLIHFQHLEEDRYLQTFIFNVRRDTGTALAEFVDYCRERWPDFALHLGFPAENVDAVSWLEGAGVPCIERSWNFLLNLDGCGAFPEPSGVKRITADNFEDFAAIHRQIQGDMYWNCERVRAALDRWAIFVTGAGETAGEVLMTLDGRPDEEIFALEFADGQYHEEAFRALLSAALNCLKANGTKWLTFFVDEGAPEGEILKALGFRLVGGYVCYRLKL